MRRGPRPAIRVGVDTGGTFTDLVWVGPRGLLRVLKIPSTPKDPARGVLAGLSELGLLRGSVPIIHGTTVATNAFLQRRGGRTALVTTRGFEDLLVLGRQARAELYRLDPPVEKVWIPSRLRFGLAERTGPGGEILNPLHASSLERLRRRLRALKVEAVAICLLHSYANPRHEKAVARALRGEGWHLSLSHLIANEFREYERTCTTVANATLASPLKRYLVRLARRLGRSRLKVMTSSGGWISSYQAAATPVRTILSGPAGGALGAALLGRAAGFSRLITLDMGGTSTDISLCEGEVPRVHSILLDGIVLKVPALDVRSVGAGGGSIARVDSGGGLRVGPESAGADPGPACYGQGGKTATLTDAHLILGRLPPEGLLGGRVLLDARPARAALGRIARKLELTVEEVALGVVRVADAALERAVRSISAGRGRHPGNYSLLVFGGAGGIHACSLASALGIRRVVVPPNPGAFSALGLCTSPPTWEASRTLMERGKRFSERRLARCLASLEREGRRNLTRAGYPPVRQRVEREADLRYAGQSHELTLPVRPGLEEAFHRAHVKCFGYSRPGGEMELVTLRVRVSAPSPRWIPGHLPVARTVERSKAVEVMISPGRSTRARLCRRETLPPGTLVRGPALITEYSATTWVAPGYTLRVDPGANLILSAAGDRRS